MEEQNAFQENLLRCIFLPAGCQFSVASFLFCQRHVLFFGTMAVSSHMPCHNHDYFLLSFQQKGRVASGTVSCMEPFCHCFKLRNSFSQLKTAAAARLKAGFNSITGRKKNIYRLLMQKKTIETIIETEISGRAAVSSQRILIVGETPGVLSFFKEVLFMQKTILIIEDDGNIRELLRLYLEREGYKIETAQDGLEGLRAFKRIHPDLVLLDLMMPVMDGTQVMKEIREISKTPVIMLTAKGETFDKVAGLELGADDYVTKPFETRELIARIKAVLRRYSDDEAPKKLEFDNLIIDKESYNITVKGKKMEIPPKEIELLYFLASSPNRVFTRAQLLDDVWGFDYFGDTRTVDVHVKRLREKLQDVSPEWEIKTVWGVGYKFELNENK